VFAADDLPGIDETTALRVIAHARSIAPCLDSLDGELKKSAVAVLTGVAREAVGRGSRAVKRQNVGPAGIEYVPAASWFTDDDRSALRAMCSVVAGPTPGLPVGRFPKAGLLSRVWPEQADEC
jgi:hypothetical protein